MRALHFFRADGARADDGAAGRPGPASPSIGDGALPFVRSPLIRDFARYWLSIRGERLLPGRRDIDPTAIPHHLPHLWLWSFDGASGRFTLRLAGEVVARRFPTARRGTPLDAFIPPDVLDVIRVRYTRVVRTPVAVHVIGESIVEGGISLFSERLLLPLGDDGRTGDGLIGITVYGETADRDLGFVRESGSVETWLSLERARPEPEGPADPLRS